MMKRVIVVEDDVLVGFDLLEQLIDQGFDAVGPFQTAEDACSEFATNGCDMAVLDVNLGRDTSEKFANLLRDNEVPFVILSGYSKEQHPKSLLGEKSVTKPVHIPVLVKLLQGLPGTSQA